MYEPIISFFISIWLFTEKYIYLSIYLVRVSDVPDPMRYLFISGGYRPCLSWSSCIRSILILHNETINIWTHLLGFCYFSWLLLANLLEKQDHIQDKWDLGAVTIQLLAYQVGMILSSIYHTFSCHSPNMLAKCLQADHAGILIALLGTYFRLIVTIFRCFPIAGFCHLVIINLLFSLTVYKKYWSKGRRSATDIFIFISLGVYAVAPFCHWISLSNTLVVNTIAEEVSYVSSITRMTDFLKFVIWMFCPYLIGTLGVLFYASSIPERLLPSGCVDILGASHQIWHVCIFVGMASWYHILNWIALATSHHCEVVGLVDNESLVR